MSKKIGFHGGGGWVATLIGGKNHQTQTLFKEGKRRQSEKTEASVLLADQLLGPVREKEEPYQLKGKGKTRATGLSTKGYRWKVACSLLGASQKEKLKVFPRTEEKDPCGDQASQKVVASSKAIVVADKVLEQGHSEDVMSREGLRSAAAAE